MKLNVSRYNFFVISSIFVFFCYLISFFHHVTDVGKNRCSMTYMYEYPQFVKISMTDKLNKLSRRYGLYAYSEGKYIERTRNMKFTGIPVLFVPGHGGSFKQVRSLASVTTHRTMDLQSIFHFDFFTIDFNGELSALYGGTLQDQHEFIVSCIRKVLNLYPVNNRPKSVIIIGHSMGGMIARSLFTNRHFDPTSVQLIITLATPHQSVILLDQNLKEFYRQVDTFWHDEKKKRWNRLENLTLISIGGGSRDKLVRPGLTFNALADLNVLTNAIPGVIASTDHLCILWCNNFIKTLSRVLYDAVDFDVKGITQDKAHLRNIFYYHLVHCSNGKYYTPDIHQERMKFTKNSKWKEIRQNHFSLIFKNGLAEDTHVIIKKPRDKDYDSIVVEAMNIDKRDWISECHVFVHVNQTMQCEEGDNLSQFGTVGFNKTLNRKYIRMRYEMLKNFTLSSHLIVRLPPTLEETGLNVDIYKRKSRIINVNLKFFEMSRPKMVVEHTKQGALWYSLRLKNMDTMWKVYHLRLTPKYCTNGKHSAYTVFKSSWSHDSSHAVVNWEEQETLKLILLTIPPKIMKKLPSVDLILDPSCSYTVTIKASYLDSVGVITARYSHCLIGNIASILTLALARQYLSFEELRKCPSFLESVSRGAMFWVMYPVIRLINFIWENTKLDEYFGQLDTQLLSEDTADDFAIPLVLYFVSFAIIYVIGFIIQTLITANVWIYEKYSLRKILDKLLSLWDKDRVDSALSISPVWLSLCVFISSLLTCGGHAFICGTAVYFYRICYIFKKSRSRTETVKTMIDDQILPKMDAMHIQVTLFMLWLLCALIFLPNSMNAEYDLLKQDLLLSYKRLNWYLWEDTGFCFSLIFSIAVGILWHCNIPYVFLSHYRILCYPLFVIACSFLLMCQINIYRVPALVTPIFVMVAAHQYFGLRKALKLSSRSNGDDKSQNKQQ